MGDASSGVAGDAPSRRDEGLKAASVPAAHTRQVLDVCPVEASFGEPLGVAIALVAMQGLRATAWVQQALRRALEQLGTHGVPTAPPELARKLLCVDPLSPIAEFKA